MPAAQCAWIFVGVAADAQVPSGAVVSEVRFEGLSSVTTSFAQSVVVTDAGDDYDPAAIEADVTRLLATGRFTAVDHRVEVQDGGVVVTFVLRERPRITAVRFSGNVKFTERKLGEEVRLRPGDSLDLFRVREGADTIVQLYRDAGYGQASVTYDEQTLRDTGELLYVIEEGPHIRVRRILFEGNSSIDSAQLAKEITTKTYLWIFRDGKFDEDTVEADAAELQRYYRDQGFRDARVGYRLEFSEDQSDLTITFTIDEGTRYRVESIDLVGNTVFSDDELRSLMSLKPSNPVLQSRMDADVKAIRTRYGDHGYIYATVHALPIYTEASDMVLVRMEIDEGSQFRVGRIVVRGNERTKDKVIRRALDLYPDDLYKQSKADEAERELRLTQLFSTATVTPVGDQPAVRDVLVNVEESRKAGDFVFGFGVTSNSGLVGSIVLEFKNFDIFDAPRSFAEFIKLRSFYGAGQRLRLEAQPGTELNRFRVDFTEPFLMDKPVRFDASAYYFERGRDAYDERRIGSLVSLGKRLTKGPLKEWYGELAFRAETVRLDDLHVLAARDIRDSEGSTLLTSVKPSLVRDRTDNRFVPTRGDRLRLSYEQFGALGGDEFFGDLSGSYARHFTLQTDEQERKSVLSLKSVAGYIVGEAPVFERYYAGGIGSMRGFEFRGISPRQGIRDDAVGGEFMLLFTTEYSFPLYGELLRGLVFTDMGTVESDFELTAWRVAIGGGVRLQIDFFGPVPLEFDVAVPVLRDSEDEEQVFSFFIGATF